MKTYDTTLDATLVGKRETNDGWGHYLWTVTLTRKGKTRDLPYRMGLGHEQTLCGKPPKQMNPRYKPQPSCQHSRCWDKGLVPTPPSLYDVLTSLKADATHGEKFTVWCGEYGYDTDSITAQRTYFKCQESERENEAFFDADWEKILDDDDYL